MTEWVFEKGSFHSGPGWYYWDAEYPDEGSCGPFTTKEEAEAHAKLCEDDSEEKEDGIQQG